MTLTTARFSSLTRAIRNSHHHIGAEHMRYPAALFIALLLSLTPLAQTLDTGAVRGQVVDQNGAAVAGATVAIVNQFTGLKRETRADGGGYYTIAGLPLTGRYSLTVMKTGFATETREEMELRAGETATLSITL